MSLKSMWSGNPNPQAVDDAHAYKAADAKNKAKAKKAFDAENAKQAARGDGRGGVTDNQV